jgi:hypothetical protein
VSDYLEGCSRHFADTYRRSQELRRNFKSLSVLGLATTTMSTWVALLLANAFSLTNGGLAGTVWVYLATWICTFALAASLAEMASMAPTSGGQYRGFYSFVFVACVQSLTLPTQIGSRSLHHVRRASSFLTSLVGSPRSDGKHLLLQLVSLNFS